ncbi:MAG: MarR family transcriptional regulator [Thermosynechococcus sp. Uc]|uniref:helix-turn-helix domain-containing protein n=1 Tax=Thermosynechococcus sp. Uc TaxID=3034853 RepID=UPI0019DD3247|nr:helix-turn-helix domain-containing protein [Thermosynechococcus sp. Uc]MDM7326098.1 MarR family transcriptional regulator [Thermosynechococcus sp. Uc]HIK25559.1 MarR family transcriptional regulator [Thermosynechococcus sp. M46_R2017_013]
MNNQDTSSGSERGLNPADLLVLTDRQRLLLTLMRRQPKPLRVPELAEQLQWSAAEVSATLAEILQLGYVAVDNDTYQVKFGRRTPCVQPKRQSPRVAAVWDKLG